ncbi:hypothetical protein D9M68_651590 [compost metagenome]
MPTPRAITGRVATFTPRPICAITASQSTVERYSGAIRATVTWSERNSQSTTSEMITNTSTSISFSERWMTWLVAASMPALPAARRISKSALAYCRANASTAPATRVRVSALWSDR